MTGCRFFAWVPVTAAVAAVRSCPSSLTGCCVFSWVCVSVAPSLVALSVCQLGPPIRDCKHAAVFVWFLGCWVPGLSFEERKALGLTKPDPTVHASCCVYPRRTPIPEECLFQKICISSSVTVNMLGLQQSEESCGHSGCSSHRNCCCKRHHV